MSGNPYTGIPSPSPYSPEALIADGGWRTPADQRYEMNYVDPDAPEADDEDEGPVQPSEGLPKSARRGGIKYPSVDDNPEHVTVTAANGTAVTSSIDYLMDGARMTGVPLTEQQARDYIAAARHEAVLGNLTVTHPEETQTMNLDGFPDTRRPVILTQFTTETMHDTSVTTAERLYAALTGSFPTGGITPGMLPPTTVREVALEVPVPHHMLTEALISVEARIRNDRRAGMTIPEESRTVTTVGNEIIIRWEEVR